MINRKSLNNKKPSVVYIYKIENPIGWSYIGATTDFEYRRNQYLTSESKRKKVRGLNISFKKFPVESHVFSIIKIIEVDKLDDIYEIGFNIEASEIYKNYIKNNYKSLNINISYDYRKRVLQDFNDLENRFNIDYDMYINILKNKN